MFLPVTVDYFPKSRRKGNALTEVFMQHLRILQMCLSRTMKAKPHRLIISDCSNRVLFFVFLFFCQDCFSSNEVSSEQNTLGHVSTYLTLRACQNCISEKVHYKSYCHYKNWLQRTELKNVHQLEKKQKKKLFIHILPWLVRFQMHHISPKV